MKCMCNLCTRVAQQMEKRQILYHGWILKRADSGHIAVLVVNYGISNIIVLGIP